MDATEASYRETELRYKTAAERLELLEKGRIHMSNREIDSLLRSPITGIVLSQSVFQGDPVVPLTNYQPGTELCSLADMTSLLFKGTVDEIDVGKITDGMEAEIQIGALPDTKIARPRRPDLSQGQKGRQRHPLRYRIAIKETAGVTLRAGFSATASIQIRERKQVVLIPERLVIFEDGKKFVEVADNGESKGAPKTRKVEIQTGLSDGLNIEILSGLKEGEKVVERPPREIK